MIHKSVLLQESVENLIFKDSGIYIDATLGEGGHSLEILKTLKSGKLICVDIDIKQIEKFSEKLKSLNYIEQDTTDNDIDLNNDLSKTKIVFKKGELEIVLINDNFSNIFSILSSLKLNKVDGILADLGWSMTQLESVAGLSFEREFENLDMRFNQSLNVTAADLLNGLGKKELSKMFEKYSDIGGGINSLLVSEIVFERNDKPIKEVSDLLNICKKIVRIKRLESENSFYARVFQSLRIAVNGEYENLERLMIEGFESLDTSGRLLIITFHSGESKLVENFVKQLEEENHGKSIFTKFRDKYLSASIDELKRNIHSRSAKLYGVIKI